ncbi:WD40/YVTN/BNR-like repeat-containing protein [Actinoplanes sp. CA-054009]
MIRAVRVLAVAGLLLATVSCARSRPAPRETPDRTGLGTVAASELGFERHAGAVDWPAGSGWVPPGSGLHALVPLSSCALGLGDYQNGYRAVNANWTGGPACDRLRLDPAPSAARGSGELPDGWPGGGVSADAALVEPGGAILAASSRGLARYRGSEREDLARADLSKAGFEGQGSRSRVSGMVRTSSGRIIINADLVDAAGPPPAVLVSDDEGRTVRRVDLPQPAGPRPASRQLLAVLAADGDTVVAIGYGWDRPGAWRSTDGGRTWSVSTIDGLPGHLMLTRLVHSGGRWTALGGVDRTEAGEQDQTYVLTSTDGLHWKPGPTAGLGAGRITDVTVDASGTLVATGVIDDSRPHVEGRPDDFCGVVWLGDGAHPWQRGEMGCGDAPPQAVTTLRDGRVLIAGNRDLWLRAATS